MQFIQDTKNKEAIGIMNEDEYIELRNVGAGSTFLCILVYNIKREELCIFKKLRIDNDESLKLIEREIKNYSEMRHPFLPKFYGYNRKKNYIVLEFIKGQTLFNIKNMQLNLNDKLKIIYELMIALMYIHSIGKVHRDLKPENIMIDENKTLILIDFDRLIKNYNDAEISQNIGAQIFTDPEVLSFKDKKFTYKNDIYSLYKVIEYIMKDGNFMKESNEYLEMSRIFPDLQNKIYENNSPISEKNDSNK